MAAGRPVGEVGVEARLPRFERRRRRPVDLIEGGEQPLTVEVAGGEREREVVAVPEPSCRLVAEADELAHAIRDFRAHLLRRLPRGTATGRVVAGAQDVGDRVVVDALPVDLAAEGVERRLDVHLELDDAPAQVGVDLVGHEGVVQDVELPGDERVELVGLAPRRFDRAERVRVAEQLAPLQLYAFSPRRRVWCRARTRLPPRFGERGLERPELVFEEGDEPVRVGHERAVYGRVSWSFVPTPIRSWSTRVIGSGRTSEAAAATSSRNRHHSESSRVWRR